MYIVSFLFILVGKIQQKKWPKPDQTLPKPYQTRPDQTKSREMFLLLRSLVWMRRANTTAHDMLCVCSELDIVLHDLHNYVGCVGLEKHGE